MTKKDNNLIGYDGTYIIGNFNLQMLSEEENINFEESKKNILSVFIKKYFKIIDKMLKVGGLKLVNLNYYSPHYYNYRGDSIDLIIKVVNKNKLKSYIEEHKKEIQKLLDSNKSYDGYISLTANCVNEIDLDNPDIMVLVLLLKDFRKSFDNEDILYFMLDNCIYNNFIEVNK